MKKLKAVLAAFISLPTAYKGKLLHKCQLQIYFYQFLAIVIHQFGEI